jgi:hypothetical protein
MATDCSKSRAAPVGSLAGNEEEAFIVGLSGGRAIYGHFTLSEPANKAVDV